MIAGGNSRIVASDVAKRLDEVAKSLPPGITVKTVLDRSQLVDATIGTVEKNLIEGAILVAAVLFWLLGNFRAAIATHAESMAAIISAETGKPSDDALLEVMLAVEHLDWAARNAQKVLRRRRVGAGLISANQSASVGYRPMGVVGVIGPWNYPLYTPMGSIGYALAAGNAVVFKPSELSPGVGVELARLWNIAAPGAPTPAATNI